MGCGVSKFDPEEALGPNYRFNPLLRRQPHRDSDRDYSSSSTSKAPHPCNEKLLEAGSAKPDPGESGAKSRSEDGNDDVEQGKEESGGPDEAVEERLSWPASPSFREYCVDYGSSDDEGSNGRNKSEEEGESRAPLTPDEKQPAVTRRGGSRRRLKGVMSKHGPMSVMNLWNSRRGSSNSNSSSFPTCEISRTLAQR